MDMEWLLQTFDFVADSASNNNLGVNRTYRREK
jgi:hypothetical protein